MDMVEIARLPARGDEAEHSDEREEEDENDRRGDVEMVEHPLKPSRDGRRRRSSGPRPGRAAVGTNKRRGRRTARDWKSCKAGGRARRYTESAIRDISSCPPPQRRAA